MVKRHFAPHPNPPPQGLTDRHFFGDKEGRRSMSLRRTEVSTPRWSRPMNALSMLRDWRRQVQHDLLPEVHGHQSKAMADLSFAMTLLQHCRAGRLATA